MRILIAEDDLTSRNMLALILRKNGYEVIEAADGKEALEKFQSFDPPEMGILDWMMPNIDGVEVIRRVRALKSPSAPYLIMLTSKDEKEDIVLGLDAGANDYLSKPFNVRELRARVAVGQRMVEMQSALMTKIRELDSALKEIKTLSGIVPICAGCKKIRDDAGYWQQVEAYIHKHTTARFSHGICPDCMSQYYPEVFCEQDE
ncbi:Response regulator receiver protein [Desulfamplus magnetovallimortis]|uniref:Response regulator receiver protein n=1 Tax=Desulfamplus magnetovallimortis TaxID=1246637 RepID=A0A1W1H764_9BACT|nr:response regulator transcription factor [Desulfamplus magnetovallimortis]SLM28299.1 Response regulator receiver protein [Desulfamplus magnetovallimortis]